MAEILKFPTREKQAFDFLSEQLDQLLRQKGADDALIDYAVTSLTDVYRDLHADSKCHLEIRLPGQISSAEAEVLQGDIEAAIERLRREHHDLTLKLAARLVLTELRLFQHERRG